MQNGRVARTLNYEIIGTGHRRPPCRKRRGDLLRVAAGRGLSDDQRRYFREQGGCIEVLPQYRKASAFGCSFNLLPPFDGLGVRTWCSVATCDLLLPGTQA